MHFVALHVGALATWAFKSNGSTLKAPSRVAKVASWAYAPLNNVVAQNGTGGSAAAFGKRHAVPRGARHHVFKGAGARSA